mgnify:CR=1 FL=1
MYTAVTTDEFESQFKSLTKKDKPLMERIAKAILKLEQNPYAGKPLSYDLKGYRSLHVGKYRIIYEIDENTKEVILRSIGHRKHVYS